MKSLLLGSLSLLVLTGLCGFAFTPQQCNCQDNGSGWISNPTCATGSRTVLDNISCSGGTGLCTISGSFTVTLANGCDQCVRVLAVEHTVGDGSVGYSDTGGEMAVVDFDLTCGGNASFAAADFYSGPGSGGPCTGSNTATWHHTFQC